MAPRLTAFADFFERTAGGIGGMPDIGRPEPDMAFLDDDLDCQVFWDTHRRLWGHFDNHYFASIPFRLEEECRLGAAMLAYGLHVWARTRRAATIYTLGAGEGTFVRALARLGDGRLKTLCCSPTEANKTSFYERRASDDAHFFLGPFFDLTEQRLGADQQLGAFRDGFDVLLEDTTFQMYGPDRDNQLAFIAPRIRPGGVLIQIQKLANKDVGEYNRRELQKDISFKSRFFSSEQIQSKKREILKTMQQCEVDLDATKASLKGHFRYSLVTWNSGNFYTIVSSNSLQSLELMVESMVPPGTPPSFCYEQLPLVLIDQPTEGLPVRRLAWRASRSVVSGQSAHQVRLNETA